MIQPRSMLGAEIARDAGNPTNSGYGLQNLRQVGDRCISDIDDGVGTQREQVGDEETVGLAHIQTVHRLRPSHLGRRR